MRPPFGFPPQGYFQPMQMPPRFPMYAPNMMRSPIPNQMPQMPQMQQMQQMPQMPGQPPFPQQAVGGAPKLEGLLAGANSLFNNAQKFTPYIQQAAPMFKNLPALWRLYKGFKDTPDDDQDDVFDDDLFESSTVVAPVAPVERQRPRRSSRKQRQQPQQQQNIPKKNRPSVPMIFQPPFVSEND